MILLFHQGNSGAGSEPVPNLEPVQSRCLILKQSAQMPNLKLEPVPKIEPLSTAQDMALG